MNDQTATAAAKLGTQQLPAGAKKKPVAAYLFTESIHAACFLSTVTGQRPIIQRGPEQTPKGHPKIRWAYPSTKETDQAMALWNSVGTEKFGIPKDWDAMDADERKAVTNVVTAFAANLKHFLRSIHE